MNTDLPVHCPTSSLTVENGIVRCPDGPGFGVTVDPDYVKRCRPVSPQPNGGGGGCG